jgi:BON domain
MSDANLERNVEDELLWDPRVDPAEVAVSAKDGAVTLRGTVGSFRERRDATTTSSTCASIVRGTRLSSIEHLEHEAAQLRVVAPVPHQDPHLHLVIDALHAVHALGRAR